MKIVIVAVGIVAIAMLMWQVMLAVAVGNGAATQLARSIADQQKELEHIQKMFPQGK